jgi:hypothetical protein
MIVFVISYYFKTLTTTNLSLFSLFLMLHFFPEINVLNNKLTF